MRIHTCIALLGALLTISSVEAATTASKPPPHPTARPDPAQNVRRPAAKNAKSFYDYHAAGPVSENFLRTDMPVARDDDWRTAPHAADGRFFRGRRYSAPRRGVDLDQQGFNGGVGYGMEGGGYGGQGYLYMGQGGGSDAASNGGGVNLPSGYGPTYRGVWQGPVNPTRGGLNRH